MTNLVEYKPPTMIPVDPNAEVFYVATTNQILQSGSLPEHSFKPRTLLRYKKALRLFEEAGFALPCPPAHLIKYLERCAGKYKYATTGVALAAISLWHTYRELPDPTKDTKVKIHLKGLKNLTKRPPVKKAAMTRTVIKEVFESFSLSGEMTTKDVRDRALILLGFICALRREEIVRLTHGDIEFTDYGLTVKVEPIKHDPETHVLRVEKNERFQKYCAVEALKDWMNLASSESDSHETPLFRPLARGGAVRAKAITDSGIAKVIKARCKIAGFDNWKAFSGHSMRRGFATQAHEDKVSLMDIREGGRWRNVGSVEAYIDVEDSTARNIVTKGWS